MQTTTLLSKHDWILKRVALPLLLGLASFGFGRGFGSGTDPEGLGYILMGLWMLCVPIICFCSVLSFVFRRTLIGDIFLFVDFMAALFIVGISCR